MRRVLNVVVLGVVLSIFVIYCIIVIAVRKIDKREGDAAHVLDSWKIYTAELRRA